MLNPMLKSVIAGVAVTLLAAPAMASDIDSRADIENLKERIERLEGPHVEKEEGLFSIIKDNRALTFWGAIEAEASYSKVEGNGGEETSDIVLATAQFGTDITITEQIGGHIVFLYEEDDTPLDVDEANISMHFNDTLGLVVGKMYLPFGEFNSNLITDPYTIDLGETQKTALVGSFAKGMVEFRLGVFNGDVDTVEDTDNIDSIVASLVVEPHEGMSAGISYISDISETGGGLVDSAQNDYFTDAVAGISSFVSLSLGPVTIDAEIVSALDDYEEAQAELVADDDLNGNKPLAYNLEVAYSIREGLEAAARYEGTNDFKEDLTRYGLGVSYGIFEDTVLSVEYLIEDSSAVDAENVHTVTTQLAFEF